MPKHVNHPNLLESFPSVKPQQRRFPDEIVPLVNEAIANHYARQPFNHDTVAMIKGFVLDEQYHEHLVELQAAERARIEQEAK